MRDLSRRAMKAIRSEHAEGDAPRHAEIVRSAPRSERPFPNRYEDRPEEAEERAEA